MTATALNDALTAHHHAEFTAALERDAALDNLIRAAARDEDVEPSEVIAACFDAGIETIEFQQRVEIQRQRYADAALFGELPAINERLQRLEAAQAAEHRRYGDLVKREAAAHDAKLSELRHELLTQSQKLSAAMAAENRLRDSYPDGDALIEENRLAAESVKLAKQIRFLDSQLKEGGYDLTDSPALGGRAVSARNRVAEYIREKRGAVQIKAAQAEADAFARQVATVKHQRDGLQKQLDNVNARATEISLAKLRA